MRMARGNTTTIQVGFDTWKELNKRKQPGESFDDVIQRILLTQEPNSSESGELGPKEERIAQVIENWTPGRNSDEQNERREIGFKSLIWLSEQGSAKRSEFIQFLYGESGLEGVSEDGWWRRVVLPPLQLAKSRGLVDFEEGSKKWIWIG